MDGRKKVKENNAQAVNETIEAAEMAEFILIREVEK